MQMPDMDQVETSSNQRYRFALRQDGFHFSSILEYVVHFELLSVKVQFIKLRKYYDINYKKSIGDFKCQHQLKKVLTSSQTASPIANSDN